MNLIIDIGNSVAKVGLFEHGTMLQGERIATNLLASRIAEILSTQPCQRCMISSVANTSEDLGNTLSAHGTAWQMLSSSTPLPFINDYRTPQTLGPDRIAAVAGAMQKYPQQDVLIIDAGSCITYEHLTADGHYKGGNIAPGVQMRFNAMHEHTARLPQVSPDGELLPMGLDTITAMRAGVLKGLQYEIEGYIKFLRKELAATGHAPAGLKVVLTGGDSALLQQLIEETTEADANLVLYGLDYILRYDEKDT